MLGKAIGKALVQGFYHVTTGIDREVAVSSQLLKTANVVVVDVGEKQAIKMRVTCSQYLLAKVGTAVYQDALPLPFHQRRLTQPLVVQVSGTAHLAPASYLRHSGAGAATQNCYF